MTDPLAQVVELLQPSASVSKLVVAAGKWSVHRSDDGRPFYCAVLDGACVLAVAGQPPTTLHGGDFALVPAAHAFTASGLNAPEGVSHPVEVSPGVVRLGDGDGAPDVRMLVGHCAFASPDAKLLVSLLPQLVHVRGQGRLTTLVELVDDEARASRPGRDVVLAHLLQVLLIEALRCAAGPTAPPGLLRGLADAQLATALRAMHAKPTQPWTVKELARSAALSRSTFFERFRQAVGVPPMDYLLGWRMALAKDLLRRGRSDMSQVAEQVGYSSASTFSVAFARQVGMPPMRYVRELRSA